MLLRKSAGGRGKDRGTEMKEVISEGKSREEAVASALEKLGVPEDRTTVEVIEETGKLLGFIGSRSVRVKVCVIPTPAEDTEEFLKRILAFLGIEADLRVEVEEDAIYASITGDNTGMLIGRFGQTLDGIQYLSNVVLSRKYPGHLNQTNLRNINSINIKDN